SRPPGIAQPLASLGQETRAPVHAEQHPALAEPSDDAATKSAGTTAELYHAVLRAQGKIVQKPLGGITEMGVLDLQPAGGTYGFAQYIVGRLVHDIRSRLHSAEWWADRIIGLIAQEVEGEFRVLVQVGDQPRIVMPPVARIKVVRGRPKEPHPCE